MSGLARDLTALLDSGKVLTDPEDCHAYACDAVYYFARRAPEAVVLPETPQEISGILRYASDQKIPVTPRGAGTGLSAGCTPVQGGIVLDMKRMNRVLEINRGNMTARVESGAVLGPFQQQVEAMGLFYPPDPQSQEVSTIGGNVSTRAGGPRGVKYGTTAHYVLGLEVVLPDGEMIRTGGTCVKQSVGYDLTHLTTGAEGTLGVITKVNLRLLPLPPAHRTAVIVCGTLDQAARVAEKTWEATDYLNHLGTTAEPGAVAGVWTYHAPCRIGWTPTAEEAPEALLQDIPGAQYEALETTGACCGAGDLFHLRHGELSRSIRTKRLKEIRRNGARTVVTQFPFCRYYLQQGGSDLEVMHPLAFLARAYGEMREA